MKIKKRKKIILTSLVLAAAMAFSSPLWAGEVLMSESGLANWLQQKFLAREDKLSKLESRLAAVESGLQTWESQNLYKLYLWPGNTQVEYYNPGGVPGSKDSLDAPPQVHDGRTFVPLRFVGEVLGAEVIWNGDTRQVTYVTDSRQILLTVGQKDVQVAGQNLAMDAAPMIINGRTMVPVRFVGQWLGAIVKWDEGLKRVEIGYVKGGNAGGTGVSGSGEALG
ncbi:MAG: copper amine oxidase N-terminal domain-containing protein [Clostridiales bacterium]